jgi:hypothetical protein
METPPTLAPYVGGSMGFERSLFRSNAVTSMWLSSNVGGNSCSIVRWWELKSGVVLYEADLYFAVLVVEVMALKQVLRGVSYLYERIMLL